ncbi:Wzz/FepE/Etk N-terminal domain-containing protein [Acuticoccus sp.]|uniref:Wzz/FepE/Etk N-terminal domain-containing protein n=1 Tax=Acuticoccus sp. TaxID=1904378 RepID=UPI003B526362
MTIVRDPHEPWAGAPLPASVPPGYVGWSAAEARGRNGGTGEYLDLGLVLRMVRRQAWLVALCVIVGIALAVAYVVTAQPLYTSSATVLLDEERAELLDLVSSLPSAALGDASVQSEVEILKSHELALRVVDRTNLTERAEALDTEPTLIAAVIGTARGFVGGVIDAMSAEPDVAAEAAAEAPLDPRRALAETLRRNLVVERVGRSYVLQLSYEAPSPTLAAEIAQAYTASYLAFQLEANASAAESAVRWLRGRVDTRRQASVDATRELERFRRVNDLISVGSRLLSEQQLSEVMSQLILAEAEAARAGSVWSQANAVLDDGADEALAALTPSGEGRASAAVEELKGAYLGALRRRRTIVEEFGTDHPEALRLDRELVQTEAMIREELGRQVVAAKNAYDAANSRVVALREGLTAAMTNSTAGEETLSRLRQLEQTNTTFSEMYQDALTRLEKAVQQQSVPLVAARVITEANLPKGESSPSKSRSLAIGVFLGLVFGAGLGALREVRRDALETKEDVRQMIGQPLVAVVPRSRLRPKASSPSLVPLRRRSRKPPQHRPPAELSAALRSVKLAIDEHNPRQGGRTVAFLSARPNEGKTTLSIYLASMLAEHGFRTLLIDADPHSFAATRILRPDASMDLASNVEGERRPEVDELPQVGADPWYVLPLSPKARPFAGIVQAGTEGITAEIKRYRASFDYIIFDGVAASIGREAAALAPHVATAVIVNRRRHASASEVRDVAEASQWQGKLAGVILNKA